MRKYTSLIIIILYTTVKSNYSNFGSNGDALLNLFNVFLFFERIHASSKKTFQCELLKSGHFIKRTEESINKQSFSIMKL